MIVLGTAGGKHKDWAIHLFRAYCRVNNIITNCCTDQLVKDCACQKLGQTLSAQKKSALQIVPLSFWYPKRGEVFFKGHSKLGHERKKKLLYSV